MRVRLVLAFSLLMLIAVLASALVTLQIGARRAEAEATRRLTTAAIVTEALLAAERDHNRSAALEVASRLTIQQALAARDGAGLTRLAAGLRQTLGDDVVAIYAPDGTLLASDVMTGLALDDQIGLVKAALSGTSSASLLTVGGQLVNGAAAPILAGGEISGVVLVADALDGRFVRRISGLLDLTAALAIEGGPTVATEVLTGPALTPEQWAALHGQGSLWVRVTTTPRPGRGLARTLLGADNRPVGALVLALPEAGLTPIEPRDTPLYVVLTMAVLIGTMALGALAAWGLGRRLAPAPASGASPPLPVPVGVMLVDNLETRQLAGLRIDRRRRRVDVGGREVALTRTEFDLLWVLSDEPGRVIPREELLERLRGVDWQAEPGLLDTHVSNLRRKIEPDPGHPRYVLTVRGVGYRLTEAAD